MTRSTLALALSMVIAIATPQVTLAQPPSAAALVAKRTAMRPLAYMIGQWDGGGWIQRGANRYEFRGGERVQSKLDSLALLVEGRFTIAGPDGREIPVHETLGVITHEGQASGFRFGYWLASGSTGNRPLEVRDDGWTGVLEAPDGRVRYAATFREGTWHETGEFIPANGGAARRFFEMTLRRR